jgi:cytochrome P450
VAFDDHTTILNEPGLVRDLMLDRHGALTLPHNFLQQPLSELDIDQVWDLRRVVNGLLRPRAIGSVAHSVGAAVRDVLDELPPRSAAVDPVPLMERVTGRAVAELYFGADAAGVPDAVGALLDALARIIGNPFALPPNRLSPARRRIRHCHEQLVALVRPLVDERAAAPAARDDFVSRVLARAPDVPRDRLIHWIHSSLLAGHRVPAAAASWLLMLVAERPQLQIRLRPEVTRFAEAFSSGRRGSAAEYPTATAVVHETLRLYPTTWLVSRTAKRHVTLAGYQFGPGHNFIVSPYVLHRDAHEWPEAYEFLPDRWLPPARPTGLFVPFGLGMHACPGRDPAVLILVATMLAVLADWNVLRSDSRVREDPRTTLLPEGLRLTFRPRVPGVGTRISPLAG